MIKIVLDTNIIISAALSPTGNPAKITALISQNEDIQVFYNEDILKEYVRVLSYEKLKIATDVQSSIIGTFKEFGILVKPIVSEIPLPDESDRVFYDTAQTSGATLITGNIRHFPNEPFIMSPTDFLHMLKMDETEDI